MDIATNIHICNNLRLMIDFIERLIKIGQLVLDKVLLGQKTIKIIMTLENRTKRIIFNFCNIYYHSNSLLNLISLSFFNNTIIHYDNK